METRNHPAVQRDKRSKEWTRVKFFLHEETNIRVTVSRLDLADPMYRFSVGLVVERKVEGDESFEMFFPDITMQKKQNVRQGRQVRQLGEACYESDGEDSEEERTACGASRYEVTPPLAGRVHDSLKNFI